MNFSRLVIFLMFWNFIYATMHPALIFDWMNEELVEVSKFDDTATYATCIAACPVDPDSSTEKLLNNTVSITKRSTFIRDIYWDAISAKEMETEICKASFTPTLAWNYLFETYEVGYELYYEPADISFKGGYAYEQFFNKEIESSNEGKELRVEDESHEFDIVAYLEKKLRNGDPPADKLINIHRVSEDYEDVEFEVLAEPEKKLTFYWIYVLRLNISNDRRHRHVLFDGNSKNNFHTVTTNYYCKTYFGEDGMEIENTDGPEKDFGIEGFDTRTETKEKLPEFGERLVKAQIIPARMFHTQAAQEATCVYLNSVFIWETIVNGMLKKIDLFVYAIHQEWIGDVDFIFGVYDYLQDIDPVAQKETTSEDNRFSTPNVIFRHLVYQESKFKIYGVAIIIHNDLEPIKDTDRICSTKDEVKGWEYIKNTNSAIGFSYTCPHTIEVFLKLGFDKEFFHNITETLNIEPFPNTEESIKFLEEVTERFERITNLSVDD